MAVDLRTNHYRFGIDELAETTHGWYAAEDANPNPGVIPLDTTFLLRFNVQEVGGTIASNTDQQFQCRQNGGAWQDITTTSTIVKAVAAAAFANGADATKRLSGTGTFEASGAGCTEDGLSGGPQNDIAASGCSETECALQLLSANIAQGDTIEFRLTSPDFPITNNVVPTLAIPVTRTPPVGDLTALGIAASLFIQTILTPAAQALAAAGLAGSLVVATPITPAVGSLALAAAAPSLMQDARVSPPVASLDLAGLAPTLEEGAGGNSTLTPAEVAALLNGLTVTMDLGIRPPTMIRLAA